MSKKVIVDAKKVLKIKCWSTISTIFGYFVFNIFAKQVLNCHNKLNSIFLFEITPAGEQLYYIKIIPSAKFHGSRISHLVKAAQ